MARRRWPYNVSAVFFRLLASATSASAECANSVLTRDQMARSSEVASRRDAALVRWTRVLSWATWVYTVLTGGLLVAAVVALLNR